jgi:hypothetical protein
MQFYLLVMCIIDEDSGDALGTQTSETLHAVMAVEHHEGVLVKQYGPEEDALAFKARTELLDLILDDMLVGQDLVDRHHLHPHDAKGFPLL